MWGRKKQSAQVAAPDLDELIQSLRRGISTNPQPEVVGQLISLLAARGTIAVQMDRPEAALDDRRTAAGLLRGFDGQQHSPVERHTDILVRMGLAAAERSAGNLDAALDASAWALDHLDGVRADDAEMCEAFVADLDALRADLASAGRRPQALRAAELASDLAARLAEQDETAHLALVGSAWVNEAGARAGNGDFDGAQALNEDAVALLEENAPSSPALAIALANRAHLQRRSGEWEEAVTTEKRLLADIPSDRRSSREELERLNALFMTQVHSGNREEAERTIDEAVAVARRLVDEDPETTRMLALLLGNQANVRGELGHLDDALVSSEEALHLREQLVLAEAPGADEGLAMALNNHSAVLRRLHRYADAEVAASRSVELRRRNVDLANPNSVALLANSLNSHADHLGRLGEGERAVTLAQEAEALFAGLPAPGAQTPYLRANQETLGTVLSVAGRYDEAVEAALRAVALGRQAAADAPGEVPELASCLESLADRFEQTGRGEEAAAARAEAAALRAAPAS